MKSTRGIGCVHPGEKKKKASMDEREVRTISKLVQ